MPTYAYECKDCRHGFEIVQRMSDDALTSCEICGGDLKKKMFPVGIAFKGSGFYVNDYAAKRESTTSPTTEGAPATTSAADAPKTETVAKPADAAPAATTPTTSPAKSEAVAAAP